MHSMSYNDNYSHCSFWGRARHESQSNGFYAPINQTYNNMGSSSPIYQLESMVSQNSSLGLVTARQSQRNFPSCGRYPQSNETYQDASQRRDWQWRRHNNEALGELCSWLQATESTFSSRLSQRVETRSNCALFRPPTKDKKRSSPDSRSAKKQIATSKKSEKGKKHDLFPCLHNVLGSSITENHEIAP